jgi:type I restriction enzyme S subunit
VTTKGTLGRRAIIRPGSDEGRAYSPQITYFRVLNDQAIDGRWLYYWLGGDEFLAQANDVGHQTTMAPLINLGDMRSMRISLPPLPEQRRIAAVLGSLDDLIETDRSIHEGLRGLAIDFVAEASLDGEVVPFGDIASTVRDSVAVADLSPDTPYLGLEHFGTDGAGLTGVGRAGDVESNKSRFCAGDVLYGRLRPYFRKVDRPGFDGVCSTEIWVLRPKPGWSAALLHAIVARPEFTEWAMAGNTGTRMPRAAWDHVAAMPTPVPLGARRKRVSGRLDELWQTGVGLRNEVADLTRTRDELLPLLMSGRVRVSESLEVA